MTSTSVRGYIWAREETLPPPEMARLQLDRLRSCVDRVSHAVPFYRDRLAEAGITGATIHSLDDLQRLPFTAKEDLRDHYPYGLFAVPMHDIVRLHASSGTTGEPTVVGYTARDIELWANLVARCLAAADTTRHDIVQNAYGYGLFTGGLGLHYGAEKIGAKVIPISGGNTKRQATFLRELGSTVLCCTPSYSLMIAEALAEELDDRTSLPLRVGIFGAEPWSEEMRREIEARLKIQALDIYGLSEVIGPGVAMECPYQQGLHIFEDHFIPEIIDPDTGERLPDGDTGELVFTCVTKEALPLLRYRTRDRTRLIREPCRCGRTTVRMDKVLGRTDDMLIIRGVNVFPSQIETVVLRADGIEPHYQIVVDRGPDHMDRLAVLVEAPGEVFQGQERSGELKGRLQRELLATLGINCDVRLVGPGEILRSEGKAVRVVDNRRL